MVGDSSASQMIDSSAQKIVAAAVQVFADRGYDGTSFAHIAAAAGVSEDDVAQAFPDTATLLVAALMGRDDREGDQVDIFDSPGGLSLLAGLKLLVRGNSHNPVRCAFHTRIAAEAVRADHPARPWAVQRYQWMRSLFAGALRRDIDAGLIRADVDVAALAAHIIAMMDGLQQQWLLDPDEADMAAMFDSFIAGTIAAIAAESV